MPTINNCKCILVIGGTSGLGRKLALSILNLPSRPVVIICGRRQERLDELASSYGGSGRLKTMKLDITASPSTLRSAVNYVECTYPDVWITATPSFSVAELLL